MNPFFYNLNYSFQLRNQSHRTYSNRDKLHHLKTSMTAYEEAVINNMDVKKEKWKADKEHQEIDDEE